MYTQTNYKSKHIFDKKKQRQYIDCDNISPYLTCSICLQIFQEPHLLMCGHTFCYKCIDHWVSLYSKYGKKCPICKMDFKSRPYQKNLLASRIIDDLKIKCTKPGCTWEGMVSAERAHQKACQYNKKLNTDQKKKKKKVQIIDLEQEQVLEIDQSQILWTHPKQNWQVVFRLVNFKKSNIQIQI